MFVHSPSQPLGTLCARDGDAHPRTCLDHVLVCAAAALALGVTGCGDDTPTASEGPPQPSFEDDGTVPVDDFNAYLDAVDEAWETDAKRVAITFAHPVVQEGEQVGATLGAGDNGTTVAIVTVNGLGRRLGRGTADVRRARAGRRGLEARAGRVDAPLPRRARPRGLVDRALRLASRISLREITESAHADSFRAYP